MQEPPPPPVQEKGRIRSGFQEAMQNHKDDTQTQRNRHNTESTRGADKHIEAPRIHPFYSTFNLKTGPAASTGKRRNCHICPKHSTVFKLSACSCQSDHFHVCSSAPDAGGREGRSAQQQQNSPDPVQEHEMEAMCVFFLNCAISPPSGLSVQGSSWVVGGNYKTQSKTNMDASFAGGYDVWLIPEVKNTQQRNFTL